MMKKIFLISTLLFSATILFSQTPTADQQNKILQEAQRKLDSVMKNNPNVKKYMDKNNQVNSVPDMPAIPDIQKNPYDAMNGALAGINEKDTLFYQLPSKNNAALSKIPKKVMTKTELIAYLGRLDKKITESLSTHYGTAIGNTSTHSADEIGAAAVLALAKDEGDEAILLALKAAEKNPSNDLLLNNVGGILNNVGLEGNAIPVLVYVLQKEPNSASVLNNLGQAYTGLGDQQHAQQYLQQCISISPNHPMANLTMAYIAKKAGNAGGAGKYLENSLRGSFTVEAWNLLKRIKQDAKLMDYLKQRYKKPEYFNIYKYPLPPQCTNVFQSDTLSKVYDAYHQVLQKQQEKYEHLMNQERSMIRNSMMARLNAARSGKKVFLRPFTALGAILAAEIEKEYAENKAKFDDYRKQYREKIKQLDYAYAQDQKKIDDKHTPEIEAEEEGRISDPNLDQKIITEKNILSNSYLERYASITGDFQKENLRINKDFFDDYIFWLYFGAVDEHNYRAAFYEVVSDMLGVLSECSTTKFIEPFGSRKKINVNPNPDTIEVKEPPCPFKKISKQFVFGKFELTCEDIKFEAGEGLVLNLEHSFKTHHTIIAIGPGMEGTIGEFEYENLGLKGSIDAAAKMQYFLAFDGGGNVVDQGLKWEGEMVLKETISPGIGEVTVANVNIHGGWTLGVNTGWTFDEGTLFPAIGKVIDVIQQ
jgi:Flp pilus assembly protein TadD